MFETDAGWLTQQGWDGVYSGLPILMLSLAAGYVSWGSSPGMQYLTMRKPKLDYANEVSCLSTSCTKPDPGIGFFVLQWASPTCSSGCRTGDLVPAIMAIYEFLVRRWNVIRFLFGMKLLPPRPAVAKKRKSAALPSLVRCC